MSELTDRIRSEFKASDFDIEVAGRDMPSAVVEVQYYIYLKN